MILLQKIPHFLSTDEVGSLVRGKALLLTERRAFALGSEVASSYKATALP
ncbi:hypothetical protein PG294_09970 [Riemerella anatipestifer]|nr:hypothetical protein [Riemerella anatipestifer]MCO7319573.1 hypothetical protein [Riemerella anatipestifer]MCQ4064578.1 hypothetical protein [Riemerella anatipestifer]MCQ4155921.1 hypothetical protein [Riemerella anatipestifer]MCT6754589.1 hypothetical protein [Riemerella anatipestifer]MCT6763891.1 hypothetical protein [Riemerella anatipestifer]